ncbi:hypothetical protein HAX54_014046 [Datura stramonium]|uniref:RING-type E3 ubiquitin transferase n=1 Tax=Datura stramonium TaxID=4076 RepID=A0ABS8TMI4_DATST|nr:hypothetical protein [Datura stramonium]
MLPTNFVSHNCSSTSFVRVKPISKRQRSIIHNNINIPPIANSYSSYLPYLTIHFNFEIQEQYRYIPRNDLEPVVVTHATRQGSTEPSQIVLHIADVMLYPRLDRAISEALGDWKDRFEEQEYRSIIERTTRLLTKLMNMNKKYSNCKRRQTSDVCVDLTLTIQHVCYGRILFASEEYLSGRGMVPASKSSIMELLSNKIVVDERNIKDECMICLEKIGKERSEVLCMPCSHIFHGECITKWLEKSHYCPLCRFEMRTEQ